MKLDKKMFLVRSLHGIEDLLESLALAPIIDVIMGK